MSEDVQSKLARLALLEQKIEIQDGLPHLHGLPWYRWAKTFFSSTHKYNFLCAANQISKSSTQIRKNIDWATDVAKWPKLWPLRTPRQFWYLYPTREISTIEFDKKWIPEFLPRGKYKDHHQYGWRAEYKNKYIWALHFNSGVTCYFKTYEQDVQHLQAGSADALFCDEELPAEIFPELSMRIAATDGYFHMVFTATRGEELWRETMEEHGRNERFPDALKLQVSMYDCLTYDDGTPSIWTRDRIERIKNTCQSEAEIQRRVYGRFVVDSGLKYEAFDRTVNVKESHPLPADWLIYAGIDLGSGGDNHPAAIVFLAVAPDFRSGRIFKGWRGDGIQTTASDVLLKFQDMKGTMVMSGVFYDYSSKDFHTIATRVGESVLPAEKSHESGEQILNVLFKNQMLAIYDTPELKPLIHELSSLLKSTPKRSAKDDYCDALRYACVKVPWSWEAIHGDVIVKARPSEESEIERLRKGMLDEGDPDLSGFINDEIEEWNSLY